jgi:hypothetical protein
MTTGGPATWADPRWRDAIEAWARARGGVAAAEMDGHGDAPAMWLVDFADQLDDGSG